ncbi:MAG: membrane protein insertase YidC [Opitutales bacterium]
MDKKNTLVGVLLLGLAFVLLFWTARPPDEPLAREEDRPVPATEEDRPDDLRELVTPDGEERPSPVRPAEPARPQPVNGDEFPSAMEDEREGEELVALENEHFRVVFTNLGGAIRHVELKRYPDEKGSEEPYIFNEDHFSPALALMDFPGADAQSLYRLVESAADRVVYALTLNEQLELHRTYTIFRDVSNGSPAAHTVRHETRFVNTGEQDLLVDPFGVNLGTAVPVDERDQGLYLNFGHYDGDKARFVRRGDFLGGGIMDWIGLRTRPPVPVITGDHRIVWASVKNQFFTGILTPDEATRGFVARPVTLPMIEGELTERVGVTGTVQFDLSRLNAGEERVVGMDYYVGPKEYRRIERLEQEQDLVMQFGFFGFLSKILLVMMTGIYSFIPNYGLAIITTTVIIKTLLLPLTAKAAYSSKRMMKIQEPMKEVREKYKDNPQKMQQETMKLFRENKVNPLGGCLPILIQLPIFFALFRMLQSASELRFGEFLWVQDLSAPDTVATIMGLPINILPVLMGVTMFIQMKMMPTATANPMQQKVFMFMPPVITLVLYNFSSGLTLYWTVNNLLTILQQQYINRKKDDDTDVVASKTEDKEVARTAVASPASKKKKPKKKQGKRKV